MEVGVLDIQLPIQRCRIGIMARTAGKREWRRLRRDFELQANQYHELTLSIYFMTPDNFVEDEPFGHSNHRIMLWQYFGNAEPDTPANKFMNARIAEFGLTNAMVTAFGVVTGAQTNLFRRMAYRAGSLISDEVRLIMIENIMRNVVDPNLPGKPVFICNPDPLSVWLTFVLTFIATLQPERFQRRTLSVDPFAASLAALDYLTLSKPRQTKVNNKGTETGPTNKRFKVALSFPGEKRRYVSKIAKGLTDRLGQNSIFYDKYFEAELAKPNLDLTLQKIYHEDSELIVIFICREYEQKDWCGLEWRAIRDIIKDRRDKDIMPMRFDDAKIPGLFSIDGYIDLRKRSANETVDLICQRLGEMNNHP